MRDRVTWFAPLDTADGQGGRARAWREVRTSWAEVRTPRIREQLFAGAPAAKLTTEIVIRKTTATRPRRGWRAVCRGTTYTITGVYDYNRECAVALAEEVGT